MGCSETNCLIDIVANTWKDVIIAGQGLAGTALAKELLDHNIDFTVVNRYSPTSSSLVAAGIFNPLVFKRLTLTWRVNHVLPKMLSFYTSIEELLGTTLLHRLPLIKLLNEHEFEFWKKRSASPDITDYIKSLLEKPEIQGINSFDACAQVEPAGFVVLKDLITLFGKYLEQTGRYIEDNLDYHDIIVRDDGVEWKGLKAKKLIFCQGVRNQENPFFNFVTFYPVLGELLRIRTKQLNEDKIINKNCYILPQGNHEFVVGSTYHWAYREVRPTDKGRTELFGKLQEILDHIPQVIDFYAGVRPTIKDRRPVLGFHPEYPQLGIFNGLGTRGVMLAPYFAGEMANMLMDPYYNTLPEVRLERFLI